MKTLNCLVNMVDEALKLADNSLDDAKQAKVELINKRNKIRSATNTILDKYKLL